MSLHLTTLLIPRTLLALFKGLKWLMGLVQFPDLSWQKLVKEFHLTHSNCLFEDDYCTSAFSSKTISKQLCRMVSVRKRGSIFQQQRVSDFFVLLFIVRGSEENKTQDLVTQDFGVPQVMPFLTRMGLWEPEPICFLLHLQILQDGF